MIDLRARYGKRYKVMLDESWEGGDKTPLYEIRGKRGYIRVWGEDELELYLESAVIAGRLERSSKLFKPKNHYDDATAFTFNPGTHPEALIAACKYIKAKNRRQMTPEALETLRNRARKFLNPNNQRSIGQTL